MPSLNMAFVWGGTDALKAQLTRLAQEFRPAAMQAIREEAEIDMTEAKRRTPVKTGNLRASGHVEGPDDNGAVSLIFGGPAAPYAVYVHENLDAHHEVGQAKFLESVMLESIPTMSERLVESILAKLNRER